MGVLLSLIVVDLLSHIKLLPKLCAVRYYLAGTPTFPSNSFSLVNLADMHCIHKSNVPFIGQKMSFEVKNCKRETVDQVSSSTKVKEKLKVETLGPQELNKNC